MSASRVARGVTPGSAAISADVVVRHPIAPFVCVAACIFVQAALIAPGDVLAGDAADAVLVFLLLQAAPRPIGRNAQFSRARAAILALVLVPLIRVVGLALPLRDGSGAAGVLSVAILIGGAALGLAPAVGLSRRTLLPTGLARSQLPTVLVGLVLGVFAYLLGAPSLWSSGAPSPQVMLAVLAAACAAVVEEIVFRGVVQLTLQRVALVTGMLASSALFAATYLESYSGPLILAYALAGLMFARSVARTGALGAPVVGHILLVLGAGALWPTLFGRVHPSPIFESCSTIALVLAVAVMTVISIVRPLQPPSGDGVDLS